LAGGLGGQYTLNMWHSGAYDIVFATNGTVRARMLSTGPLELGGGSTGFLHTTAGQNLMFGAGTRNAVRLAPLADPGGAEIACTDSTGGVAYKPIKLMGSTASLVESAGSNSLTVSTSGATFNCSVTLSAGVAAIPLGSSGAVALRFGAQETGIYAEAQTGPNRDHLYFKGRGTELARFTNVAGTLGATFAGFVAATSVMSSGAILSSGATNGVGYSAGAGGTVTQLTSKSTGVTINRPSGQIITHNAALAAGAIVHIVVTNSAVGENDNVVPTLKSGPASAGSYCYWVTGVAAGSFTLTIENRSAGSLSEVLVFNFAVIKGAIS
jgi:hypothetical protein